jgi:hypothetical protein
VNSATTLALSASPVFRPLTTWTAPLAAVAILLVLKSIPLVVYGPTTMPDTAGYVAYAHAIVTGTFTHVDLQHDPNPALLMRPIGYPAVIAAAMRLSPAHWAWLVVLLQFAASIAATVMVYRLARAFGLGAWLSIAVAAAQATALQFVLDQALLSDSLAASMMTIGTCLLCGAILRRSPRNPLIFLSAGALFACAFLMRPVVEFLAVGFVPLAAAAAMVQRSRLGKAAAFALFFIPVLATHVAYTQWNRVRAGMAVVTTTSETTLLEALVAASRYDPTIFSGSTPIDTAARQVLPAAGEDAYVRIYEILHRDYGWDAFRLSHEATIAYLQAWLHHPVAMIRHTLAPMSETQVHQAVRPTETVRDVLLWNTGSDHDFARDRAVRGDWWMIFAVIVHRIAETFSVAVFAAFLIVTLLRLWREGLSAETSASIGLWFAYMWVAWLYAAVHLEPRYLSPVVAGSIVVGTVNLVWMAGRFRRVPATASASEAAGGKRLETTA